MTICKMVYQLVLETKKHRLSLGHFTARRSAIVAARRTFLIEDECPFMAAGDNGYHHPGLTQDGDELLWSAALIGRRARDLEARLQVEAVMLNPLSIDQRGARRILDWRVFRPDKSKARAGGAS